MSSQAPSRCDVRVRKTGVAGTTVMDLAGEINIYNISTLSAALRAVLKAAPSGIVMNLCEVRYIDSTGLGVLFGGLKKLREHGGSITIVVADPHLKKVFEITGISAIFPIVASEKDALATKPAA